MIQSMTGFGRSTFDIRGISFEVEMRSVNHRYLDVRVRMPRSFAEFEGDMKSRVSRGLARGKIDMNVAPSGGASGLASVEVDHDAARSYAEAARSLATELGSGAVIGALDVNTLLSLPGVTRLGEIEISREEFSEAIGPAVDAAVSALRAMRDREGRALADEFSSRLLRIDSLVADLESRSDLVQKAVREKLRKRSEQLREETGLLDEARLHQEIVIAADRLDITEETVRMRSHTEQFRAILCGDASSDEEGPQAVGRRLDFLLQEMGRETNTVGSKANDAPLAHTVVELKTELERIREQVQNVE